MTSSKRYSYPWNQTLHLRPSAAKRFYLLLLHAFAALVHLYYAPVYPAWVLVLVLALILISFYVHLVSPPTLELASLSHDNGRWSIVIRKRAFHRLSDRCKRLSNAFSAAFGESADGLRINLSDDEATVVNLCKQSIGLYPAVMFLTFRSMAGEVFRFDLWKDQLSKDEYRRLSVLLRFSP